MIKTILAIIISVTFFGVFYFIVVRNSLKNKLDQLVKDNKKKRNQAIISSLLNSTASRFNTLFDNSKLNPPRAIIPISFL